MCVISYVGLTLRINEGASSAFFLVSRAQAPILFLLLFPVMCSVHPFLIKRDEVKSLPDVFYSTYKAREPWLKNCWMEGGTLVLLTGLGQSTLLWVLVGSLCRVG